MLAGVIGARSIGPSDMSWGISYGVSYCDTGNGAEFRAFSWHSGMPMAVDISSHEVLGSSVHWPG